MFVFTSHGIPNLVGDKIEKKLGKKSSDIKVLYITTPQNTYPKDAPWIEESLNFLKKFSFQITQFDIEGKSERVVRKVVDSCDVVWVSGGNVFYLLYWAKKVGLKEILMEFLDRGGIYGGESAGVVCHIKDLEPIKSIDHPEKAPELITEGMQLTDLIVLPHSGHPKYGPDILKIQKYYEGKGLHPYLLKDGEALIIDGEKIEEFKGL